jgi:hypothetical protein
MQFATNEDLVRYSAAHGLIEFSEKTATDGAG